MIDKTADRLNQGRPEDRPFVTNAEREQLKEAFARGDKAAYDQTLGQVAQRAAWEMALPLLDLPTQTPAQRQRSVFAMVDASAKLLEMDAAYKKPDQSRGLLAEPIQMLVTKAVGESGPLVGEGKFGDAAKLVRALSLMVAGAEESGAVTAGTARQLSFLQEAGYNRFSPEVIGRMSPEEIHGTALPALQQLREAVAATRSLLNELAPDRRQSLSEAAGGAARNLKVRLDTLESESGTNGLTQEQRVLVAQAKWSLSAETISLIPTLTETSSGREAVVAVLNGAASVLTAEALRRLATDAQSALRLNSALDSFSEGLVKLLTDAGALSGAELAGVKQAAEHLAVDLANGIKTLVKIQQDALENWVNSGAAANSSQHALFHAEKTLGRLKQIADASLPVLQPVLKQAVAQLRETQEALLEHVSNKDNMKMIFGRPGDAPLVAESLLMAAETMAQSVADKLLEAKDLQDSGVSFLKAVDALLQRSETVMQKNLLPLDQVRTILRSVSEVRQAVELLIANKVLEPGAGVEVVKGIVQVLRQAVSRLLYKRGADSNSIDSPEVALGELANLLSKMSGESGRQEGSETVLAAAKEAIALLKAAGALDEAKMDPAAKSAVVDAVSKLVVRSFSSETVLQAAGEVFNLLLDPAAAQDVRGKLAEQAAAAGKKILGRPVLGEPDRAPGSVKEGGNRRGGFLLLGRPKVSSADMDRAMGNFALALLLAPDGKTGEEIASTIVQTLSEMSARGRLPGKAGDSLVTLVDRLAGYVRESNGAHSRPALELLNDALLQRRVDLLDQREDPTQIDRALARIQRHFDLGNLQALQDLAQIGRRMDMEFNRKFGAVRERVDRAFKEGRTDDALGEAFKTVWDEYVKLPGRIKDGEETSQTKAQRETLKRLFDRSLTAVILEAGGGKTLVFLMNYVLEARFGRRAGDTRGVLLVEGGDAVVRTLKEAWEAKVVEEESRVRPEEEKGFLEKKFQVHFENGDVRLKDGQDLEAQGVKNPYAKLVEALESTNTLVLFSYNSRNFATIHGRNDPALRRALRSTNLLMVDEVAKFLLDTTSYILGGSGDGTGSYAKESYVREVIERIYDVVTKLRAEKQLEVLEGNDWEKWSAEIAAENKNPRALLFYPRESRFVERNQVFFNAKGIDLIRQELGTHGAGKDVSLYEIRGVMKAVLDRRGVDFQADAEHGVHPVDENNIPQPDRVFEDLPYAAALTIKLLRESNGRLAEEGLSVGRVRVNETLQRTILREIFTANPDLRIVGGTAAGLTAARLIRAYLGLSLETVTPSTFDPTEFAVLEMGRTLHGREITFETVRDYITELAQGQGRVMAGERGIVVIFDRAFSMEQFVHNVLHSYAEGRNSVLIRLPTEMHEPFRAKLSKKLSDQQDSLRQATSEKLKELRGPDQEEALKAYFENERINYIELTGALGAEAETNVAAIAKLLGTPQQGRMILTDRRGILGVSYKAVRADIHAWAADLDGEMVAQLVGRTKEGTRTDVSIPVLYMERAEVERSLEAILDPRDWEIRPALKRNFDNPHADKAGSLRDLALLDRSIQYPNSLSVAEKVALHARYLGAVQETRSIQHTVSEILFGDLKGLLQEATADLNGTGKAWDDVRARLNQASVDLLRGFDRVARVDWGRESLSGEMWLQLLVRSVVTERVRILEGVVRDLRGLGTLEAIRLADKKFQPILEDSSRFLVNDSAYTDVPRWDPETNPELSFVTAQKFEDLISVSKWLAQPMLPTHAGGGVGEVFQQAASRYGRALGVGTVRDADSALRAVARIAAEKGVSPEELARVTESARQHVADQLGISMQELDSQLLKELPIPVQLALTTWVALLQDNDRFDRMMRFVLNDGIEWSSSSLPSLTSLDREEALSVDEQAWRLVQWAIDQRFMTVGTQQPGLTQLIAMIDAYDAVASWARDQYPSGTLRFQIPETDFRQALTAIHPAGGMVSLLAAQLPVDDSGRREWLQLSGQAIALDAQRLDASRKADLHRQGIQDSPDEGEQEQYQRQLTALEKRIADLENLLNLPAEVDGRRADLLRTVGHALDFGVLLSVGGFSRKEQVISFLHLIDPQMPRAQLGMAYDAYQSMRRNMDLNLAAVRRNGQLVTWVNLQRWVADPNSRVRLLSDPAVHRQGEDSLVYRAVAAVRQMTADRPRGVSDLTLPELREVAAQSGLEPATALQIVRADATPALWDAMQRIESQSVQDLQPMENVADLAGMASVLLQVGPPRGVEVTPAGPPAVEAAQLHELMKVAGEQRIRLHYPQQEGGEMTPEGAALLLALEPRLIDLVHQVPGKNPAMKLTSLFWNMLTGVYGLQRIDPSLPHQVPLIDLAHAVHDTTEEGDRQTALLDLVVERLGTVPQTALHRLLETVIQQCLCLEGNWNQALADAAADVAAGRIKLTREQQAQLRRQMVLEVLRPLQVSFLGEGQQEESLDRLLLQATEGEVAELAMQGVQSERPEGLRTALEQMLNQPEGPFEQMINAMLEHKRVEVLTRHLFPYSKDQPLALEPGTPAGQAVDQMAADLVGRNQVPRQEAEAVASAILNHKRNPDGLPAALTGNEQNDKRWDGLLASGIRLLADNPAIHDHPALTGDRNLQQALDRRRTMPALFADRLVVLIHQTAMEARAFELMRQRTDADSPAGRILSGFVRQDGTADVVGFQEALRRPGRLLRELSSLNLSQDQVGLVALLLQPSLIWSGRYQAVGQAVTEEWAGRAILPQTAGSAMTLKQATDALPRFAWAAAVDVQGFGSWPEAIQVIRVVRQSPSLMVGQPRLRRAVSLMRHALEKGLEDAEGVPDLVALGADGSRSLKELELLGQQADMVETLDPLAKHPVAYATASQLAWANRARLPSGRLGMQHLEDNTSYREAIRRIKQAEDQDILYTRQMAQLIVWTDEGNAAQAEAYLAGLPAGDFKEFLETTYRLYQGHRTIFNGGLNLDDSALQEIRQVDPALQTPAGLRVYAAERMQSEGVPILKNVLEPLRQRVKQAQRRAMATANRSGLDEAESERFMQAAGQAVIQQALDLEIPARHRELLLRLIDFASEIADPQQREDLALIREDLAPQSGRPFHYSDLIAAEGTLGELLGKVFRPYGILLQSHHSGEFVAGEVGVWVTEEVIPGEVVEVALLRQDWGTYRRSTAQGQQGIAWVYLPGSEAMVYNSRRMIQDPSWLLRQKGTFFHQAPSLTRRMGMPLSDDDLRTAEQATDLVIEVTQAGAQPMKEALADHQAGVSKEEATHAIQDRFEWWLALRGDRRPYQRVHRDSDLSRFLARCLIGNGRNDLATQERALARAKAELGNFIPELEAILARWSEAAVPSRDLLSHLRVIAGTVAAEPPLYGTAFLVAMSLVVQQAGGMEAFRARLRGGSPEDALRQLAKQTYDANFLNRAARRAAQQQRYEALERTPEGVVYGILAPAVEKAKAASPNDAAAQQPLAPDVIQGLRQAVQKLQTAVQTTDASVTLPAIPDGMTFDQLSDLLDEMDRTFLVPKFGIFLAAITDAVTGGWVERRTEIEVSGEKGESVAIVKAFPGVEPVSMQFRSYAVVDRTPSGIQKKEQRATELNQLGKDGQYPVLTQRIVDRLKARQSELGLTGQEISILEQVVPLSGQTAQAQAGTVPVTVETLLQLEETEEVHHLTDVLRTKAGGRPGENENVRVVRQIVRPDGILAALLTSQGLDPSNPASWPVDMPRAVFEASAKLTRLGQTKQPSVDLRQLLYHLDKTLASRQGREYSMAYALVALALDHVQPALQTQTGMDLQQAVAGAAQGPTLVENTLLEASKLAYPTAFSTQGLDSVKIQRNPAATRFVKNQLTIATPRGPVTLEMETYQPGSLGPWTYTALYSLLQQVGSVLEARQRAGDQTPVRILDIGTGDGPFPIALHRFFGDRVKIVAIEIEQTRYEIAQRNLKRYGLMDIVDLRFGNAFNLVSETEEFDIVIGNMPARPTPPKDRFATQRDAVIDTSNQGGLDGRLYLDQLIPFGASRLLPGGRLLFTHNSYLDTARTFSDMARFGLDQPQLVMKGSQVDPSFRMNGDQNYNDPLTDPENKGERTLADYIDGLRLVPYSGIRGFDRDAQERRTFEPIAVLGVKPVQAPTPAVASSRAPTLEAIEQQLEKVQNRLAGSRPAVQESPLARQTLADFQVRSSADDLPGTAPPPPPPAGQSGLEEGGADHIRRRIKPLHGRGWLEQRLGRLAGQYLGPAAQVRDPVRLMSGLEQMVTSAQELLRENYGFWRVIEDGKGSFVFDESTGDGHLMAGGLEENPRSFDCVHAASAMKRIVDPYLKAAGMEESAILMGSSENGLFSQDALLQVGGRRVSIVPLVNPLNPGVVAKEMVGLEEIAPVLEQRAAGDYRFSAEQLKPIRVLNTVEGPAMEFFGAGLEEGGRRASFVVMESFVQGGRVARQNWTQVSVPMEVLRVSVGLEESKLAQALKGVSTRAELVRTLQEFGGSANIRGGLEEETVQDLARVLRMPAGTVKRMMPRPVPAAAIQETNAPAPALLRLAQQLMMRQGTFAVLSDGLVVGMPESQREELADILKGIKDTEIARRIVLFGDGWQELGISEDVPVRRVVGDANVLLESLENIRIEKGLDRINVRVVRAAGEDRLLENLRLFAREFMRLEIQEITVAQRRLEAVLRGLMRALVPRGLLQQREFMDRLRKELELLRVRA